jgi:ketosteroid isomerase-like protein
MHEQSVAAIALAISAVATVFGGQIAEESARTVVEKRFAAVNRHDLDAIVALYAPDAVDVSPDFCADRSGPEGARRTYRELFQAYPNVTADPTVSIVEGHRVAVQFFARARDAGGTMTLDVRLAPVLTVEHGRITRDDTYFDPKGRPCS